MTAVREALAAELDRHHAIVMGAPGQLAWLDCSCGWSDGQMTKARGRLVGSRERWRLHQADAVLSVVRVGRAS